MEHLRQIIYTMGSCLLISKQALVYYSNVTVTALLLSDCQQEFYNFCKILRPVILCNI